MRVTILAILVGLASGLVALFAGSRLREVPLTPPRWPALLVGAVLAYRAPAWLDTPEELGVALAIGAYAGLILFATANLRLRGMVVVLIGLLANAAVLVANEGMPVDEEAVVAAGVADSDELPYLDLDAPREWRAPEHRLVLLSDIVPVAPLREVVSFGDLILAVGLANVVFRLVPPLIGPSRPAGGSRRDSRARRAASARRPSPEPEPEAAEAQEPEPEAAEPEKEEPQAAGRAATDAGAPSG